MRTIESKGAFARRKHRSPACVTKWISTGKISAAALVGSGYRANIWVEQAEADLAASLTPHQQYAQAFPATSRTTPWRG